MCIKCDVTCKSCKGTSRKDCLDCAGENMVKGMNAICECINGFYFNFQTGKCERCNEFCYTCLDKDICLSCNYTNMIVGENNICKCK